MSGFRLGAKEVENRLRLRRFLDEPFVTVVLSTQDIAETYGELFAKLRRAGTPIPTNDIWIAVATIRSGAQLVTFDTDFDLVPGLDVALFR